MNFRIESSAAWTASEADPKPDVSFVPPMERRRLTGVERAALATAWKVRTETDIPVVFASRWGEIGVTVRLMRQFHADGEMSPAGFSASVHNAAPGAFSLLTHNHASYTAIAARERSLECGILEALALNSPVVFVFAEESTPAFYASAFGPLETARSVAVRLVPDPSGDCHVTFRHADMPPATSDAFLDFLEGRVASFATADLELTRS